MLQEKIVFSIKGKSYESLPLIIGRVIDFYKTRALLASGTYQMLYSDYVGTPVNIAEAISAQAFMQIFCPKFIEDLKPNTISEMGLVDFAEVLDVYLKDIKPFIESLANFLTTKNEG
jgi:hypothetical protein